jgi:PAS domain S-box-containing protein
MSAGTPGMGDVPAFNEIHRFFDLSPDLLAIIGTDGYFKRLNPAWDRALGYPLHKLLSRPALDFLHPDDLPATQAVRARDRHQFPEIANFVNRYRRRDGSYIWLEWTAQYYPQEDLSYCVARDITMRKQAEDSLWESQQNFRRIADSAPVMIWIAGIDKLTYFFNQTWLNFRGRTLEQELGNGWTEGVHPDDQTECLQSYFTAFDARQFFDIEYRLQRADGEYRWMLDIGVPNYGSDGNFLGYIGTCVEIHDRKEALDALQRNEQTLRQWLNASQDSAFLTDVDSRLIALNDTAAWIFHAPANELIGKCVYDLMTPEWGATRKARIQTVIETRKPTNFSAPYGDRFVDVTHSPIFAQDGQVSGIATFSHDITHLKQTEEALRQSERTLRDLINGIQDIVFLTDADDNLRAYNTKFAEQLSDSMSDLTNASMKDLLPPDFVPIRQAIFDRALAQREPIREKIEFKGQYFDYSVYPILNDAGEVVSLATFSRDITFGQQVEQKLRNSEARFRGVLESAAEGILLAKLTGEIVLLNRRVEEQFGYSREELLGQPVETLLPDVKRERHIFHRETYSQNPATRPMGIGMELYGQRKDGSVFPIEVSLSQLLSDGDMLVMALVTDITERKQIETERLEHEKLQVELAKEREMVALRQQFNSMVSHEFRTPLTAIASTCEILEHYHDRLSPEQRMERVRGLNTQVRSMVSLLDDFLAINRMQAGATEIQPESLETILFCRRLLETVRLIDTQHHVIRLNVVSAPPTLYADPRMLEHILTNLLSNAIKYSPPGSAIDWAVYKWRDRTVFEVRDQGRGIPAKDQDKLFQPFYRAGNVRDVTGTGLGLAIVKQYIELHGGSISFESSEQRGTIFRVELPSYPA